MITFIFVILSWQIPRFNGTEGMHDAGLPGCAGALIAQYYNYYDIVYL